MNDSCDKRRSVVGFRLAELAGSIPPNHRPFRNSRSGRRAFLIGQVWVVRATEELWEVVPPVPTAPGSRGLVTLTRYGKFWRTRGTGQLITVKLPPAILLVTMWPLEDAIGIRRDEVTTLRGQFAAGILNREAFPTFAAVAHYLGIDPETGCRID